MRKIIQYFLQGYESPGQLNKIVNRLLTEGWELYGSPYSDGMGSDETLWHYQAMVKYEDEDNEEG